MPLPYPPGREGDQSSSGDASVHTTPDGVTLVSHLNVLSFWDVRTGTQTAPPMVLDLPKEWLSLSGGPDVVLRPGHDHLLIQTDKGLELWDFRARERLHTFDNRGAGTPVVSEDGTVAAVRHSGSTAWFEHLCQLSDRDFTDEERAALPEGVDPRRPCAR